jgi:hypothetical protein
MSDRDLLNAREPILVTVEGMRTHTRELQFSKALSGMAVTAFERVIAEFDPHEEQLSQG